MDNRTEFGNLPDQSALPPPHVSTLPICLYLLSFATPLPSLTRQPRDFCTHPFVLYTFGCLCAIAAGLWFPAFDNILGWWTNQVSDDQVTNARVILVGSQAAGMMVGVGVVLLFSLALMLTSFTLASIHLTSSLRERYFESIIVQDFAFHDTIGPGEISTRISQDIEEIREAFGVRAVEVLKVISTFTACLISSFLQSPKLAGFVFSTVPVMLILLGFLQAKNRSTPEKVVSLKGQAASLCEQILSSIRVVHSYSMEAHVVKHLDVDMLKPLRRLGRINSAFQSAQNGIMLCMTYWIFSMSFWFGAKQVESGLGIGSVVIIYYNFANSSWGLVKVLPQIIKIKAALSSLSRLRAHIERRPTIDVRDRGGIRLVKSVDWKPSFTFDRVTFAYPSRPSSQVLCNVSLDLDAGCFTAVVGPSGSGKSTIAALLLRLYDPCLGVIPNKQDQDLQPSLDVDYEAFAKRSPGVVKFAGHDLRSLNIKWLRSQVAVVLQNPQLMSGTIMDNVAAGLVGSNLDHRKDVNDPQSDTFSQIQSCCEEALRKAQAWEFVSKLPKGILTEISGGRAGLLSGGQCQRIALARALVGRPECLILDEATSAISTDVEFKIQEMLLEEKRTRGMTLVVIAHRLSTIAAADKIIVMDNGTVVQTGAYDQLLAAEGTFRDLVTARGDESISNVKERIACQVASPTADVVVTSNVGQSNVSNNAEDPVPPIISRVSHALRTTKWFLLGGFVAGSVVATSFVLGSWFLGKAVNNLNNPKISEIQRHSNRWALVFLVIGLIVLISAFLNPFLIQYSGQEGLRVLKRDSVRCLIRQDIRFFDNPVGQTGGLTAAISTHTANIGSVLEMILAEMSYSSLVVVGTVVLNFVFDWRFGIMALVAISLATLCGWLSFRLSSTFEETIVKHMKDESDYVCEAANSAQLIASMGREAEVLRRFKVNIQQRSDGKWFVLGGNMCLASAQAILFPFTAVLLWISSQELIKSSSNYFKTFAVVEVAILAVFLSSQFLIYIGDYIGDFTRMFSSKKAIQKWLDLTPDSNIKGSCNTSRDRTGLSGIAFNEVELRYPSRPGHLALKKVTCHMDAGKTFAFCGMSGAGKSSVLSVLQRFYEPTAGSVTLNGVDIREIDLGEFRGRMGFVSQEAVLFEGTIRWNVAIGAQDPELVTDEEILWACEQACMLDFIQGTPDGLSTELGIKGVRLSGGQRQRLCIARALVRKPEILLLDEATSSLDNQSEAFVQQAIENASKGRTVIMIAHRLTTIRNADVIMVMDQGQIVETGSHDQLLAKEAKYWELVNAQL